MTRSDVKVGDKVRSKVYGNGVIEDDGHKLVGVRFDGGSYRAYIKDDWSSTLEDDSIEFIQPIKVGDTVTLIDKPWEHFLWNTLPRDYRKEYIKTKGKTRSIEGFYDGTYPIAGVRCAFPASESRYIIPIELLEKVEELPKEPKKGDLFRVIGNDGHHFHSVGDIVEFLEVASERSYVTYCPKTGRTQFVHKTDLEPYDGIHRHTPEQVAEAQRIIGEIVAGFKYGQRFYIRDESDRELNIRYLAEEAVGMHTITAHCSPHDEFNRTIGVLVALCKATGRKLPDWV